jgi:Predicted extracellular nuclease
MDYVKISVPIVGGYTPYNIQFAKEKGVGDDCYPSSFEGQTLEVTGVVTAVRPDQQYPNFFFQDPIKKEWGRMFVYVNEGYSPPKIGDLIKLKGDIVEYYGMTEMKKNCFNYSSIFKKVGRSFALKCYINFVGVFIGS